MMPRRTPAARRATLAAIDRLLWQLAIGSALGWFAAALLLGGHHG